MSRLARLLAALACGIQAVRLGDEEFKEKLLDMVRSRSSSNAPPPKMSIVILGNRKTGKSTICQWLLARTDVCKVYSSPGDDQTTQNHEIVSGHWFNTPELGELEVMDTKGFLGNLPGQDWTELSTLLKAQMPKIDAVILASTATCEACGFRDGILDRIRRSFGVDIWENIIRTIRPDNEPMYIARDTTCWNNFANDRLQCYLKQQDGTCSSTCAELGADCAEDTNNICAQTGGWKQAKEDTVKADWDKTFEDLEFREASDRSADWSRPENAQKKLELEDTIKDTPYYTALLKDPTVNSDFPMVKASDPDWSSSFLTDSEYMQAYTHLGKLVALRQWIVDKRETTGQWELDVNPRFGPSIVDHPQDFNCGWPNQCELTITGQYLSNADRLEVFPFDHECGTDFEAWTSPKPFDQLQVRPRSKNEDEEDAHLSRIYNLNIAKHLNTKEATQFKICYCEYGSCGVPERFFQEVGTLTIKSVQCDVECPSSQTTEDIECGIVDGKQVTVLAREKPLFSCKYGYSADGEAGVKTYDRVCSDDGALIGSKSCQLVKCQKPKLPANAKRITSDNGQSYVFGTPVKFECLSDFTIDGNLQANKRIFDVVCGDDGAFDFAPDQGPAGESFANFVGCRKWSVGSFTECPGGCGVSQQTRSVSCVPEGASCSATGKPEASQECRTSTTCPNCGVPPPLPAHSMLAYRDEVPVLNTEGEVVSYECDYENRYTLTGGNWRPGVPVGFNVQCRVHETEARAVYRWKNSRTGEDATGLVAANKICRRWETTDWGECSASCGSGYRTRKVQCSSGDDSDCPEADKPRGVILQRTCYVSKTCANEENAASPSGSPALLVWALIAAAYTSYTR